jgi:hypothetical protein
MFRSSMKKTNRLPRGGPKIPLRLEKRKNNIQSWNQQLPINQSKETSIQIASIALYYSAIKKVITCYACHVEVLCLENNDTHTAPLASSKGLPYQLRDLD